MIGPMERDLASGTAGVVLIRLVRIVGRLVWWGEDPSSRWGGSAAGDWGMGFRRGRA